jgi:two-component system, response regulator FlrC
MSLNILLVEDDKALREALVDTLELQGYHCQQADCGEAAIACLQSYKADVVLTDINMPGISGYELFEFLQQNKPELPVILMTAFGDVKKAVEVVRQGALDYLLKPVNVSQLHCLLEKLESNEVMVDDQPIACAPSSKRVLELAQRVAVTDSTVMICGESGTGKEVLAQYIHQVSPRKGEAFVAINCAAIPENMLESTLFGYEKGAFTGAVSAQAGKFEMADGGTILLDEISEMDLGLQAKLLRVIQEREVERIGGRKTIKLDVRIVATTNRDLLSYVKEGKFREDLYYRLNVFPLGWRPLRERIEDIVPLASKLLQHHSVKMNKKGVQFSDSAQATLLDYAWPGNVRELDNAIQRALILQNGQFINEYDLGLQGEHLIDFESRREVQTPEFSLQMASSESDIQAVKGVDSKPELKPELKKHEFDLIADAINQSGGRKKLAAEKLGISPRTLRYKLAKMREMGLFLEQSVPERMVC